MKIKAEMFGGSNLRGQYYECFKNPTAKEWQTIINDDRFNSVRGIIIDNGDLYIWVSELLHYYAIKLFNIPNGIHIQLYDKDTLSVHLIPETDLEYMYKAFTNTTSLYNFMSNNFTIDFIDHSTYGAPEDDRYSKIHNMDDIKKYHNEPIIAKKVKRLIKKAEIFSGANIDNNLYKYKYYECFKNPTLQEWNDLSKLRSTMRGVLLRNGDVYVWSGEILHEKAEQLFGIPNGIHFQTYSKNSFNIYLIPETDLEYMNKAFMNTTSLYRYLDKNAKIIEINYNYYNAEENDKYKNIKYINDIAEQFKTVNAFKKQAEIFNGANFKRKNNDYYECFKNPTIKEWNEVLKVGKAIRGMLLDNGDLYIWTSEILHVEAINLFSIPQGIHLIIHNSNNIQMELTKEIDYEYLYSAFTRTISLYNYVNKNCNIDDIDIYFYSAKKDERYENIKSINDLVEQHQVVASIKRAEIFNGANINNEYLECFKNPSRKEWDSIFKIDIARGILQDNGDLYIWLSDITHDDAANKFNLPIGIHLQIYSQSSIGMFLIPETNLEYMYEAFTNTTSLYNYVDKNCRILEINTQYYHAEHDDRYYRIKNANDIITQYNLIPTASLNIKRLIQAEIHNGTLYKDAYYECFKNPTSKDWTELMKTSLNARGILLDSGELYIWNAEILHREALGLFQLPNGIHLEIYDGGHAIGIYPIATTDLNYMYKAFTNTTSLYNYTDENFEIYFIDTDMYDAKYDERYDDIRSKNDLITVANEEPTTASKIKRLVKAEIYDGTNYENKYYECFKNPTSKE